MQQWIDRLSEQRTLPSEGYLSILECEDQQAIEYLFSRARAAAELNFGRAIFVRGLIEITNCCRNNCYYCGIRASNSSVSRYRLSDEQIIECSRRSYDMGFRTFVLQGGEDPLFDLQRSVDLISKIRAVYPDAAITLSLGEFAREDYQRLFDAGADRYLLRHESHNAHHYSMLHPASMSIKSRLKALRDLKGIGYQTGTGIMVGTPHQSLDNIVEDIEFIEHFKPQMVGIGPFIPHHATPFAECAAGSVELTLRLISIFRLINPHLLIPATTALSSLCEMGRERGVLAGANVVMPNISPSNVRGSYELYDNKASFGSEAGEGLSLLGAQLARIGYSINFDRGDYNGEL